MIKPKTGLVGVLDRITSVVRLVRPVDTTPHYPYTRCGGCGKGGRDDQQVPDPDQFVKPKTVADTVKAIGDASTAPVKDAEIKLIDAAPVWCAPCRKWYHAVKCYSLHRSGTGAHD